MNLEVLSLTKGLAAARKGAFKRLCTIVYMHVGPKTRLACELLVATGMRAHEVRRS